MDGFVRFIKIGFPTFRWFLFSAVWVAALGVSARAGAQAAGSAGAPGHGVNPTYFDSTCSACDQFYRYANGSSLRTPAIPPDRPGCRSFAGIYEQSLVALRAVH